MRDRVFAIFAFVLLSPVAMAQATVSGGRSASEAAADSATREVPKAHSSQQVERALQIAKLAAANGMQQLSLRAAKESLNGGPPIQLAPTGSTVVQGFRTLGATLPGANSVSPSTDMIRKNLGELSQLWKEQKFDPQAVYETLEAIVLPAGRPEEVFFYEQTIASATQGSADFLQPASVATYVIQWAQAANAVERLNSKLEVIKSSQRARVPATVLQAMLAAQMPDRTLLQTQLGQLKMYLAQAPTGHDAEIAGQLAFPMLNSPDVGMDAVAIVEEVLDPIVVGSTTNRNYHVEPATKILKLLAAGYTRAGNKEKVREVVARLLNVNSTYNNRYSSSSSDYVARMRQAQLNTAVAVYVEAGLFEDAVPLIAEYAELQAVTGRSFSQDYSGTLFRSLLTINAKKRYEILRKLCTPGATIKAVNLYSRFMPYSTPLPIFMPPATSSGAEEHVSVGDFDRLRMGLLRDVVSSGGMLVQAAKQAGRLEELTTDLQPFIDSPEEGVDVLVFMSQRESLEPDLKLLEKILLGREKSLAALSNSTALRTRLNSLDDYLLATCAAEMPALAGPAMKLLNVIHRKSKDTQNAPVRTHVRQAIEHLNVMQAGADPGILADPNLKYGHMADCDSYLTHSSGSVKSSWVVHDQFVQNLSAPQDGLLYFRYPLVGDFEVSALVTEGGWSEGGFVYDGILSQNQAYNKSFLVLHVARPLHKNFEINLTSDQAALTHLALQVADDKSVVCVNRHVAYRDMSSAASPFLALKSSGGWSAGFAKLQITGNPRIPQQVNLLTDHRLRGWSAYYNESLTSAFADAAPDDSFDWLFADGVLKAAANFSSSGAGSESLLTYLRPMLSGDKLSWEFQYTPGQSGCHPALGQLAFLLNPDGVKLHWITDAEHEWAPLAADNAVVESSSQRGPDQLPLRENDWNKAELSIDGRTVRLVLNGELVLEREHELQLQTQFGFFRNRLNEAVGVRNVVLTGDWPKTFAEAVEGGILSQNNIELSQESRHALSGAIEQEKFSLLGYTVAGDLETLSAGDRLKALRRWVLPDSNTLYVRDRGGFIPAYSAADSQAEEVSASEDGAVASANAATETAVAKSWHRQPGGLVSPALDMVFAAAETGQLDELKQEVEFVSANHRLGQNVRSCDAILSAIATAQGDFDQANKKINAVYERVKVSRQKTERLRWSAFVTAWNAIQFPETIDGGLKILEYIVDKQFNAGISNGWEFDHSVRAMRGLARRRWNIAAGLEKALPPDGDWIPVTRVRGQTASLGIGPPQWSQNPYGGPTHHCGHEEDLLYYSVPLHGDFTVECEMTSFGWREVRFLYDDHWLGIDSTRKQYEHGRSWLALPTTEFSSVPLDVGDWFQCKLQVQNGICSRWVNGTKIFEEQLSETPDPWLAIRCGANIEGGSIRNLKITGTPAVPDVLQLSGQADLKGWTAGHFRQGESDWVKNGVDIVGTRRASDGMESRESLLQYHRPLLEDGTIQYDFACDAEADSGVRHVHPAMGRLAFILGKDRVSEHLISDGIYGLDGLLPDNSTVIDGNHITADPLPLKTGVNHMQVTLTGDRLLLTLNDTEIYRRVLSKSDQRFFGLFHYAGQTEANVRNVTYQGNWRRELPLLAEQQFAGLAENFSLKVDPTDASKSITHSFEAAGLPEQLFHASVNSVDGVAVQVTSAGVVVNHSGGEGWTSKTLSPHLAIEGDFDVTAAFADLNVKTPDADKSSGIQLGLTFMNDTKDIVEVMRRTRGNGNQVVESMWVVHHKDGTKYLSSSSPDTANFGRFRLSRRGDVVLWMYAAEDSSQFRVLRAERVSDAPVVLGGIDFEAQVGGVGGVSVVWKDFTVQADKILTTEPNVKTTVLNPEGNQTTVSVNFATDIDLSELLVRSGDPTQFFTGKDGLVVTTPGTDAWKETRLDSEFGLTGDFDVSVDLQVQDVQKPTVGAHSGAYFRLVFESELSHRIDVQAVCRQDGSQQVAAIEVTEDSTGKKNYNSLGSETLPASEVQSMRIVRKGSEAKFYFTNAKGESVELANANVGTKNVVPKGVRLMVHTGGEGPTTKVLWKKPTVSGSQLTKAVASP